MKPDVFLAAYRRSVDNIPVVLALWPSLDDELREHTARELIRLLVERASLLREGVFVGASGDLFHALDEKMRSLSTAMRTVLGADFPSEMMP